MDASSEFLSSLENEMLGAEFEAHMTHDETVGDVLDLLHLIACLSGRPVAMRGAVDPRLRLVRPHSLAEECTALEALLDHKIDPLIDERKAEESCKNDES